jgi:hypothetical protein
MSVRLEAAVSTMTSYIFALTLQAGLSLTAKGARSKYRSCSSQKRAALAALARTHSPGSEAIRSRFVVKFQTKANNRQPIP